MVREKVRVVVTAPEGRQQVVEVDKVLQAIGFAPRVEGYGLERTGVRLTDRGAIAIDDHLRTNVAHLMDRRRFERVRGDVNERTVMEVDEVYHLACPASPIHYQRNPVRTIRTCVMGTLHMLELCREVSTRLLIDSLSFVEKISMSSSVIFKSISPASTMKFCCPS